MSTSRLLLCATAMALGLAVAPPLAGASIVNQADGRDDVWPAADRQNLTYCVSETFGAFSHGRVAAVIDSAAAEWEAATDGGIDYVHVAHEDHNCGRRNGNVLFSVEPTNRKVFDRAFYPSEPRRKRRILVNADLLFNGEYAAAGVMRHELGHTLGLRHEHTRPEAGACFEDDSWRPLTPYDSASVMHYPWCSGNPTASFTLSPWDIEGVASLY